MISRTEERFGLKPARLAADTAYGSAATLNWIVNEKKIAPHIPVLPGPRIVVLARSRQSAARRHPSAKFRAASTRTLAILPVHWPTLKRSQQSRRDRKRVEMLFARLKRILKLGRLRLRGPRGAEDEFTLAAIAQNLRRLAKLVVRPPPTLDLCLA